MITVVPPKKNGTECSPVERKGLEVQAPVNVIKTESRTILVQAPICDASGPDPESPFTDVPSTGGVRLEGDECVEVTDLGNGQWRISLKACGEGHAALSMERCGFKIANGVVEAFPLPIITVGSDDGSIIATKTECALDLRANFSSIALPSRVLCATGACAEAGKAIGIINITAVEGGGFQLAGCALAGEGATGAALAYPIDIFDTLANAIIAMNAATLTASFGACGGGGA